jgi:hypothetical protein
MLVGRYASTLAVGAIVGLGVAGFGSAASAADLPLKAPPAPASSPFVLDIHGFVDISIKNDYITPRGLVVHDSGLASQYLMGMVFDVYKDKNGFIQDISFNAGFWNDLWSKQNDAHVGSWNEFDWFIGAEIKFAQKWKFGVTYIEFLPPAHDLITSFPSNERNVEFTLSYDDSGMWGPYPFAFNPYVRGWYAASGPSNVVLGKGGDTGYAEFGITPTYDFKKTYGYAFTLSAPTWFSVGPSDYWNKNVFIAGSAADIQSRFFAGATNFCGPQSNQACSTSNVGVISSGLTGKWDLAAYIPPRLGAWYLKAGFQWYHQANDALRAAQIFTGAASNKPNVYGNFTQTNSDEIQGFLATGFTF